MVFTWESEYRPGQLIGTGLKGEFRVCGCTLGPKGAGSCSHTVTFTHSWEIHRRTSSPYTFLTVPMHKTAVTDANVFFNDDLLQTITMTIRAHHVQGKFQWKRMQLFTIYANYTMWTWHNSISCAMEEARLTWVMSSTALVTSGAVNPRLRALPGQGQRELGEQAGVCLGHFVSTSTK